MKKFYKLLNFILVVVAIVFMNKAKCYAAEVQYTDNVIPTMTSNTSPSGKASASSVYQNTDKSIQYIYFAFDKSTSSVSGWCSIGNKGWLSYEFENEKCITKYTIVARNASLYINQLPKDWTFEARKDETSDWVVLDKQTNVTGWKIGVKKEFTFINSNPYKEYRINITANNGNALISIGELEMMETVSNIKSPTNLIVNDDVTNVNLSWDAVEGATSYNIKRSETAGGPYDTIASVSGSVITMNDADVYYGNTYYYTISAVNESGESANSNEASVTLQEPVKKLKLVLEVKEEKQLSVSEELSDNADMTWTSSDLAIATIDSYGKIKAIKPGNTIITCTSEDGSYTETINVLIVDLDLQLAVDLTVSNTCRLTIDDMANKTKVTWVADDPSIATVTSKGKVIAVGEGLTYITAVDSDGNELGRIYIRVR